MVLSISASLGKPAEALADHFVKEGEDAGYFQGRARVTLGNLAVVEYVPIEIDLVFGIEFRSSDARVDIVGIANPTVATIPVFGAGRAIGKGDKNFSWKNEVTFAMDEHVVAIFAFGRRDLVGVAVVGLAGSHAVTLRPPGIGIGVDFGNFVIEDTSAGDGLVEIPLQILAGDFFDGVFEVGAGGMGEAEAHEVGVNGAAHGVFADDVF